MTKTRLETRLWNGLILTLTAFVCAALTGCGPTDQDRISDAQSCLNTATIATAASCVSMVDGIVGSNASLIRCSGAFIQEGFGDASKIGTALGNLNTSGGGASDSMAMMAVLAFQANADVSINLSNAQAAQTDCTASGSPGMMFLSGIAVTATQAVALTAALLPRGFDPQNIQPSDITSGLTALITGSAADQAVVGGAILDIYDVSCQNGSTTAGNYCQQFQSVIDHVGSAPAAVGAFLATCYTTTPAPAGCQGF